MTQKNDIKCILKCIITYNNYGIRFCCYQILFKFIYSKRGCCSFLSLLIINFDLGNN